MPSRKQLLADDHLKNHRLTIKSNILGPQRLSIEYQHRTIPVEIPPANLNLGRPLFSFGIDDEQTVVGSVDAPLGVLYRNNLYLATIQPEIIPARKRLMIRSKHVHFGNLVLGGTTLPISCTLWLGLVSTDFKLCNDSGRHMAIWKRSYTRTRILVTANVSAELFCAILGLVLYTEIEKDFSC